MGPGHKALDDRAGVWTTILTDDPELFDEYDIVAGPARFVLRAETYDDFAVAMAKKLHRELPVPVVARVDNCCTFGIQAWCTRSPDVVAHCAGVCFCDSFVSVAPSRHGHCLLCASGSYQDPGDASWQGQVFHGDFVRARLVSVLHS